jgi:Spy/CpxP family protein refolding chaperone
MRMNTIWVLLGLLLSGLLASAQPMRTGRGDSPQALERVERWRKMRLIEVLELKEEQSVRFLPRMNEHEQRMRDLHKEKDEVLDKIDRLVRNRADDKEIEKVFPEFFAVDARMGEERQNFFNSTSDILTVEQRAKFLLFERHFERELREAMREVSRRRPPREEP